MTTAVTAQKRLPTRPRARLTQRPSIVRPALPAAGGQGADPYVDYGRYLTGTGGILILYKGVDEASRHSLWRLFAWTLFTGFEAWIALADVPIDNLWIKAGCCAAAAFINCLIVAKAVEIYRRIEIRPDCMIIDGAEVFLEAHMEGWPSFRQEVEGRFTLSGTYGTRFVEYLTVRRFDHFDRMPEVLMGDLAGAMKQLWSHQF